MANPQNPTGQPLKVMLGSGDLELNSRSRLKAKLNELFTVRSQFFVVDIHLQVMKNYFFLYSVFLIFCKQYILFL